MVCTKNGRQNTLDFHPFMCHETKNVFCKTKKVVVFFAVYETINIHLEFPKRCIYEHMNTFSQNIKHLRPTWHYKHEL